MSQAEGLVSSIAVLSPAGDITLKSMPRESAASVLPVDLSGVVDQPMR